MIATPIRIVTALPAEARPIIQRLGLVRDNTAAEFPLYRNGRQALVVSGVGVAASQEATHWLARLQPVSAVWINLGIAGHPHRPVGEAVMASEIVDRESGDRWQTRLPDGLPCPSERLISCREPEIRLQQTALYDMEAAGFFPAALCNSIAARIFCLKIVSDNREHPGHGISGRRVSQLIASRLDILDWLIGSNSG